MQARTSGWPVTWKSEKTWKSGGKMGQGKLGKVREFDDLFKNSGKITFLSNLTRDPN